MILRGSLKGNAFLSRVERYVSGADVSKSPEIDGDSGLVYMGAGYWRGLLWASPTTRLIDDPRSQIYGLTLINPDRTPEEIRAVELGVSILAMLEYERAR